jgi:hypothetical protein
MSLKQVPLHCSTKVGLAQSHPTNSSPVYDLQRPSLSTPRTTNVHMPYLLHGMRCLICSVPLEKLLGLRPDGAGDCKGSCLFQGVRSATVVCRVSTACRTSLQCSQDMQVRKRTRQSASVLRHTGDLSLDSPPSSLVTHLDDTSHTSQNPRYKKPTEEVNEADKHKRLLKMTIAGPTLGLRSLEQYMQKKGGW